MAKKTTAVATRKAAPEERTPEQRIDLIRGYLDRMEAVQLQFASGAILIGMELLALKENLPHGEFIGVFKERLERPRFSIRNAQQYMQDANRVRVKLLKQGHMNIAQVWDVPPSALTIAKRRELQGMIDQVVDGKSLHGLRGAMGTDKPRQLTARGPSGADAEREAHGRVWVDLCKRLTEAAVHRKTWKYLSADSRRIVREQVKLALDAIPED